MKPSRVALYEFMPYGAPELLEVSQPHLTRALATASGGLIAAFAVAFVLATWFAGRPVERGIDIIVCRLAPPPLIRLPPESPRLPIPHVARQTGGPVVPVREETVETSTPIAPPADAREGAPEGTSGSPGVELAGSAGTIEPNDHPGLDEYRYFEQAPAIVSAPIPVYPDMAREAGIDGFVALRVLVGRDGRVKDVHVDRSVPMLDEAAIVAVRRWVFTPALANGQPVAVWVAVPVHFSLH